MRLSSFVLLAATAPPIRVASSLRVSSSLMTKNNATSMNPLFNGGLADKPAVGPANQLLNSEHTTNDEERTPQQVFAEKLGSATKKTVLKLYAEMNGPRLEPCDWKKMIVADEAMLKRVGLTIQTDAGASVEELGKMVAIAVKTAPSTLKLMNQFEIGKWMQGLDQSHLEIILRRHRFFGKFNFEKFRVLEAHLGLSGKARLYDILTKGFQYSTFLGFLSIRKLSPLVGEDAKTLQRELLIHWMNSEKLTFGEMARRVKLKKRGWMYTTLDPLLEYVKLRIPGFSTGQVNYELIKRLTALYTIPELQEMIRKGKTMKRQHAMAYLGSKYNIPEIASQKVKHVDLADILEKELERFWVAVTANSGQTSTKPLLDYKGAPHPDLSLDLSLKPPGT